jgi:integrase
MARKKGRANGEGSVYEYPKGGGTWFAQITLLNGRTKRQRAGSQKEAVTALEGLRGLRNQGVKLGAKQPTVAEWCAIWLEKYARNLKPNIRDDYRGVVRRYIDSEPIGKRRLDLLMPAEVQDWVDNLAEHIAPQTVRNAHARLHKALTVAIVRKYRATNPADGTELPEVRSKPIHPLDFDQTLDLLDILKDDRWLPLYRLLVSLGLREGEVLGLCWDAIDLTKRTIHVYRQLKRVRKKDGAGKEFVLQTTKTPSSDRILDVDEDMITMLRTLKRIQMEEQLISGKRWKNTLGLLFTTDTGAPIHASNLLSHFHKALTTANLPQIRIHDLRHTCATLLLTDGAPLVTVSKILGHSSVAVTAKIYAHALDKSKASAIASLSQRLRRVE